MPVPIWFLTMVFSMAPPQAMLALQDPPGVDQPGRPTPPRFLLPIGIRPSARDQIARIRLLVSRDGGQTWQHVETVGPDESWLRFQAPEDGKYCFACQSQFKDGRILPGIVDRTAILKTILIRDGTIEVIREAAGHREVQSY